MAKVTKEMWAEWKAHPVTEALAEFLGVAQRSLQDQWAAGLFQGETRDEILIRNAGALGELRGYKVVKELTFEELTETFKDD